MITNKCIYVYVILMLFSVAATAQRATYAPGNIRGLKAGDTMPDIPLNNIIAYPLKAGEKISMCHFRGKLVILDFWSTGCTSCFKAFPEMEALQKQFGEKVQVILVNPFETPAAIKDRIARLKTYGHNTYIPPLPQVNGDSAWLSLFPVHTIPHHVWINDKGIIIASTGHYNATAANVTAALKGTKLNMVPKSYVIRFDLEKYPLHYWIGQQKEFPVKQTWFSDFYEGEGAPSYGYFHTNMIDSSAGTIRNAYINQDFIGVFRDLYRKMFTTDPKKSNFLSKQKIIWQVPDSLAYVQPLDGTLRDAWMRKTYFCFEVIVPLSKADKLPAITLEELNAYIGRRFGIKGEFVDRKIDGLGEVKVLLITKA